MIYDGRKLVAISHLYLGICKDPIEAEIIFRKMGIKVHRDADAGEAFVNGDDVIEFVTHLEKSIFLHSVETGLSEPSQRKISENDHLYAQYMGLPS